MSVEGGVGLVEEGSVDACGHFGESGGEGVESCSGAVVSLFCGGLGFLDPVGYDGVGVFGVEVVEAFVGESVDYGAPVAAEDDSDGGYYVLEEL